MNGNRAIRRETFPFTERFSSFFPYASSRLSVAHSIRHNVTRAHRASFTGLLFTQPLSAITPNRCLLIPSSFPFSFSASCDDNELVAFQAKSSNRFNLPLPGYVPSFSMRAQRSENEREKLFSARRFEERGSIVDDTSAILPTTGKVDQG